MYCHCSSIAETFEIMKVELSLLIFSSYAVLLDYLQTLNVDIFCAIPASPETDVFDESESGSTDFKIV